MPYCSVNEKRDVADFFILETLLGDPSMVIPLANYINAMHRFVKPSEQMTS